MILRLLPVKPRFRVHWVAVKELAHLHSYLSWLGAKKIFATAQNPTRKPSNKQTLPKMLHAIYLTLYTIQLLFLLPMAQQIFLRGFASRHKCFICTPFEPLACCPTDLTAWRIFNKTPTSTSDGQNPSEVKHDLWVKSSSLALENCSLKSGVYTKACRWNQSNSQPQNS